MNFRHHPISFEWYESEFQLKSLNLCLKLVFVDFRLGLQFPHFHGFHKKFHLIGKFHLLFFYWNNLSRFASTDCFYSIDVFLFSSCFLKRLLIIFTLLIYFDEGSSMHVMVPNIIESLKSRRLRCTGT